MEHAPTIGALCGGRLAQATGVRYEPPSISYLGGPLDPWGKRLNQLDAADGLPASSAAAAVLSGVWEQGVACSDF